MIFASSLVIKLLQMARNQYYILKGNGLATSDINQEFESLQHLVQGKAGVNFEESLLERSACEAVASPGPSHDPAHFDISPLVEFPVLSSVPITREFFFLSNQNCFLNTRVDFGASLLKQPL